MKFDPRNIAQSFKAELARRSFVDFAARMDPRFANPPPFMRLMLNELADVERGRTRFLAESIPPRHSKTTAACVLLPAFAIGRAPASEIVIASHSVDLAERSSRLARDLLLGDAWPFSTRLAPDSTAATRWHVTGGGSVRALGVGSKLLGLGADLLVVDDAIADSNSDSECEAAFDWLQRIASGRLNKGGRIIVIGQRLRETDLIGRILEDASIGQQFRVINLPAICQDEDLDIERTLGRRNGDCLWPAQFGLDELSVRRNLMGEISFACQFLGNPIPTGGHGLIQPEWLLGNRYDRIPDDGKVSFAIDAAAKTGLKNDYSALCVLKSTKTHHYLVDMIRSKVDYNGLKRILLEAAKAYEPDVIYIEDTSNGVALVQQLRAETDLPIVPKSAKGSKVSRWEAQTGTLEAGRLLIPADRLARPWLTEFLREMLSLPNSRFDDQADALFLALAQVAKPSRELIFATLSTVAGRPAKSAIYGADSDPYVSNGPAGQAVYDTFTGELVSGTPRRARDPWDDIPRARPRPAPSPRVSHRW